MLKQVHPTRTAPLRKDCKHYVMGKRPDAALCGHPGTPISLTDGSPVMSTSCMRGDDGAVFRLMKVTPCGSTGNLFEPLVERLNNVDNMVLAEQGHVSGCRSGQVPPEQIGVAFGEAVAESGINVGNGDIEPSLNELGRVQFSLPHESLPQVGEGCNVSASSNGQEATPCE